MSIVANPTSASPRLLARAIALLMLTTIVLGVVAQGFISERLISLTEPAKTAGNILTHKTLYQTGFTLYMIEMAAQISQTVLMFFLLKPVNRRLAALALAFGLVGCTIKTLSRVFYLAPLFLLNRNAMGALNADQLSAVSLILLNVNDHGAGVALAFFGFEAVVEGWLVFRSGFLPRWLGALAMISSVGWLTFLSPTLGYTVFNVVALGALIGSIAMIGWLLVKGVDEERWRALAATEAVR